MAGVIPAPATNSAGRLAALAIPNSANMGEPGIDGLEGDGNFRRDAVAVMVIGCRSGNPMDAGAPAKNGAVPLHHAGVVRSGAEVFYLFLPIIGHEGAQASHFVSGGHGAGLKRAGFYERGRRRSQGGRRRSQGGQRGAGFVREIIAIVVQTRSVKPIPGSPAAHFASRLAVLSVQDAASVIKSGAYVRESSGNQVCWNINLSVTAVSEVLLFPADYGAILFYAANIAKGGAYFLELGFRRRRVIRHRLAPAAHFTSRSAVTHQPAVFIRS